jgi:hypothetical protein
MTADQREPQRPVGSTGRWIINMSRPGAAAIGKIVGSPGSANLLWGTGLLCNSSNRFLRDMARAEIEGLAIRCGALPQAACGINVKLGRHLKAAGCGLPDGGARR